MDRYLSLFDGDSLLTSAEVARLFRVERRTVQKWSREQRPGWPHLKVLRLPDGRGLRYRKSDIEELLEELTEKGGDRDG